MEEGELGYRELADRFELATDHVRTLAHRLSNDKLLYFYARFKQAKEGVCNTSRPGFFDFEGKQKWDCWKKLGTMSEMQAMKEYINELLRVDPSWHADAETTKTTTGMGVAVSTLYKEEVQIRDDQKTIFDWLKEDNISKVQSLMQNCNEDVTNQVDDQGLTLLHWACDRGLEKMVNLLLKYNANINAKDEDGQTPLHYAVTCEFVPVIKLLLDHGADVSIEDNDGCLPSANTYNKDIISLLGCP
ncbi:acyl-CoA-binding domain-containing protein 6-like [Saccoglossus kowalevskii]|uniref:Acyl-CoA-binding domain-containing protein 6 n=1 Tax=Saccoglossus kowalevskii TaxID=10224 RepID=A0ABM0GIP4_SACKO|nr:PREDICTED: acyl-CoA-binding domain-containing protein 6-like [Saccoglossus kowalevskii]